MGSFPDFFAARTVPAFGPVSETAVRSANSDRCGASSLRPRTSRAFTVPEGTPVSRLISSTERSSKWCSTMTCRRSGLSLRTAATTAARSGLSPDSVSPPWFACR